MEFTYRLVGTGWAEARIADGSNWAALSASYLDDALGDLLEAVGVLLEGAEAARCSWAEEPGEYRWIFERSGPLVRLRILVFPGLWSNEPDENGTVCFETEQPLREVAEAVARAAEAVLADNGEDGYLERWVDHPFPTDHLAMIRQHLAAL